MKDFLIVVALLLFIVAGFYAFQLLVLGLIGTVIYFSLPTIRKLHSKGRSWKS